MATGEDDFLHHHSEGTDGNVYLSGQCCSEREAKLNIYRWRHRPSLPSQEASFIGEWSIVDSNVGWKMLGPFP